MSSNPIEPTSSEPRDGRTRRYAFLALLVLLVLASPIVAGFVAWVVLKLIFLSPGVREWTRDEQAR